MPLHGSAIRFPLAPLPAESTRGYIARVASHNVHEHHTDALNAAGIDIEDVLAGRVHADTLNYIYGFDRSWDSRLWPQGSSSNDPGPVMIYGAEMKGSLFYLKMRRVSVAGLRKSLHHRYAWTIKTLTFCPESWDLLIDHCPSCDHRLSWSNGALWRCQDCAFDLRLARSVGVRPEHRGVLSVFSDLFSAEAPLRDAARTKLPSCLQHISLRTIIRLIGLIGRSFEMQKSPQVCQAGLPHNYPIAAWAGLDVLLNLRERPDALASASRESRARLSALRAGLAGLANCYGEPRDAAFAILSMMQPERTTSTVGRVFSVGEAAYALKIGKVQVRQLVEVGVLRSCRSVGGGIRLHDSFSSDAIERVLKEISDRVSLSTLSRKMNVSQKIIIALLRSGHLETVDTKLTRTLFKEVQLHSSSVERLSSLKSRLQRCSHRDPTRVKLCNLFPTMGVGVKPWARAINEAAVAGELGAPDPRKIRKSDLSVSLAWAQQIEQGTNGWICNSEIDDSSILLIDAEDYLNLLPRDISRLIAHGQLERGGAGLTAESVLRCSRLLISTKEIAARAGIPADSIAGLASRAGLARLYPSAGFWPRASAEAVFGISRLNLPPG